MRRPRRDRSIAWEHDNRVKLCMAVGRERLATHRGAIAPLTAAVALDQWDRKREKGRAIRGLGVWRRGRDEFSD